MMEGVFYSDPQRMRRISHNQHDIGEDGLHGVLQTSSLFNRHVHRE